MRGCRDFFSPIGSASNDAAPARSRPYRLAQADAAADDLAERLHLRDVRGDDRRLCVECIHLAGRPGAWRCSIHRAAGVGRDLPTAWVTLPQRCPGFAA